METGTFIIDSNFSENNGEMIILAALFTKNLQPSFSDHIKDVMKHQPNNSGMSIARQSGDL
jgi:hypothetical protein